jgi:opacity protein-like surface antigen
VYLGSQTWNRTISTTKYTIAVGLTAGFGVALSPSATLDVSYRYLDTGKVNGQDTSSQQLRVGVRYMLN